jgi:hypothetical protein
MGGFGIHRGLLNFPLSQMNGLPEILRVSLMFLHGSPAFGPKNAELFVAVNSEPKSAKDTKQSNLG